MKKMHSVDVTILGQTYRLRSDKDSGYMEGLASKLNSKISEIATTAPTVDAQKLITLTALNLMDQLQEHESKQEGDLRLIEERAKALLDKLNAYLEDHVQNNV